MLWFLFGKILYMSADNINAGDISREISGEISALSLPKLPALPMKKSYRLLTYFLHF